MVKHPSIRILLPHSVCFSANHAHIDISGHDDIFSGGFTASMCLTTCAADTPYACCLCLMHMRKVVSNGNPIVVLF